MLSKVLDFLGLHLENQFIIFGLNDDLLIFLNGLHCLFKLLVIVFILLLQTFDFADKLRVAGVGRLPQGGLELQQQGFFNLIEGFDLHVPLLHFFDPCVDFGLLLLLFTDE